MAISRLDIDSAVDRLFFFSGRGNLIGIPTRPGTSSTAVTGVPTNGIAGYAPGAIFFNFKAASPGTMFYVNVGTALSATWRNIDANAAIAALAVTGVAGGYKLARGQATTVAASDTIVTGLATVVSAGANLESDPVLTCTWATAAIGNQSGAPAAGSILLKTWMPTSDSDGTPIAATTFGKVANWWAIGT